MNNQSGDLPSCKVNFAKCPTILLNPLPGQHPGNRISTVCAHAFFLKLSDLPTDHWLRGSVTLYLLCSYLCFIFLCSPHMPWGWSGSSPVVHSRREEWRWEGGRCVSEWAWGNWAIVKDSDLKELNNYHQWAKADWVWLISDICNFSPMRHPL